MLDQIYLFVFGLLLLIKGGDWFVDSASSIARRFKLPDLLIGATVVSIGTTLPEVMVSATAAMQGSGGMAYGNAIGSIICNTSLIAATTIAVKPSKVDKKPMILPVTFFFIAAIFYVLTAYISGEFTRVTGIVLLALFVTYMVLTVLQMKKDNGDKSVKVESIPEPEIAERGDSLLKSILFLIVGAAVIAVGADLLVDNGIKIAETLGVPETVISLTFVALGTSLPELVTAITALMKGHGALSLGNIIGANLFNLVLVSGVATVILPFEVPTTTLIGGIRSSFLIDIPVMLAVMLILVLPALLRGKLSRAQGISLLAIYAAFCAAQFILPVVLN